MARLDPAKKKSWTDALDAVDPAETPWIACGLDASVQPLPARMEGMAGLIDWRLHGQVSRLLARGQLAPGECCLVPGDPGLRRPSLLLIHHAPGSEPKQFADRARRLGVKAIALAESTFPEDFLSKLKQTFKKEGIRFTNLEPES